MRITRAAALLLAVSILILVAASANADTVTEWNTIWLDCVRVTGGPPCPISRAGAMVHAAVYDAVNSIYRTHEPYLSRLPAPRYASPEAAAAVAAHDVLVYVYPGRQTILDAALTASLDPIPDGRAKAAGMEVGSLAASNIVEARRNDGSDIDTPYVPGTAPGDWRPTFPDFTAPFNPNWGHVTPWVMISGDQFRPVGPLSLTNMNSLLTHPKYTRMFADVKELGARDSRRRSEHQTQTAYFWANDVDGTYKPPGHLNHIAQVLSAQRRLSLAENARLFGLLNIALGDAGIVAWDCKYDSDIDLWRPITGIREADTDGNPRTVPDPSWEPLNAFTPPFPAYISGHATFAAAAAAIFERFFGTDRMTYTITTDEPLYTGAARTYRTFSEAAVENAQSRIFLGVHWQFDADDGLTAGRAVGEYVFSRILRPATTAAEEAADASTALAVSATPGAQQATISYEMSAPGPVRVAIFDVHGRRVATLLDGWQPGGRQTIRWDRRGADGVGVPSGVYFARVSASGVVRSAKLVLAK